LGWVIKTLLINGSWNWNRQAEAGLVFHFLDQDGRRADQNSNGISTKSIETKGGANARNRMSPQNEGETKDEFRVWK
jgi:hypothetical protein